ncbi:hypothetical protein BDR26DRAFT_853474 [Obelidium mucronatum]|nr:hypothetical protein BDR26DRAFT_853474 [Obelidium mucronatum]
MSFESYDFTSDAAFMQGLASITAKLESEGHSDQVVASKIEDAKRFYFQKYVAGGVEQHRQPETINSSHQESSQALQSTQQINSEVAPSQSDPMDELGGVVTASEQPSYPKSFAEICELVAKGEPIPGIKLIPTTVHDKALASIPVAQKRLKPWEKRQEEQGTATI